MSNKIIVAFYVFCNDDVVLDNFSNEWLILLELYELSVEKANTRISEIADKLNTLKHLNPQ